MDDSQTEVGQESGGSLREKLEGALTTNASLASELAGYKAKDIISAHGYKHVTVEDLKGVKLDEIEAKASELEVSKSALAESVLKSVLKDKLGEGADLDAVVAGLIGGSTETVDSSALDRIRSVGKVQGLPPQKLAEDPSLVGPARLRAAFGA